MRLEACNCALAICSSYRCIQGHDSPDLAEEDVYDQSPEQQEEVVYR